MVRFYFILNVDIFMEIDGIWQRLFQSNCMVCLEFLNTVQSRQEELFILFQFEFKHAYSTEERIMRCQSQDFATTTRFYYAITNGSFAHR